MSTIKKAAVKGKQNKKRPYRSLSKMPKRHVIRLSSLPEDLSIRIRKEATEYGITEQAVVNQALRKYFRSIKQDEGAE